MNSTLSKKIVNKRRHLIAMVFTMCCLLTPNVFAEPSNVRLSVWVSQAVIATYTFDFENFVKQQKEIAKYFTADGWINYSKAMESSKIPESVQKNSYYVSAVPTMPPEVKKLGDNEWQAIMPILVVYKNPAYKQKQSLKITINFVKSKKEGAGGFAVSMMKSIVIEEPCRCTPIKPLAAIV
jgi:hypothetical protein